MLHIKDCIALLNSYRPRIDLPNTFDEFVTGVGISKKMGRSPTLFMDFLQGS